MSGTYNLWRKLIAAEHKESLCRAVLEATEATEATEQSVPKNEQAIAKARFALDSAQLALAAVRARQHAAQILYEAPDDRGSNGGSIGA